MIQEENSSSNIASSLTVNGAQKPHGFSGPSNTSALSGPSARDNNAGMRREGSERKNPLVYFLGSANASVDTSHQHNQLNNDILVSDQMNAGVSDQLLDVQGGQRLAHQLFREEPIVGDS